MRKAFEWYAVVILVTIAIVALIGVINIFFTKDGTGTMDNAFHDVVDKFSEKVEIPEKPENILDPGLYDANDVLVSPWSELVNTYGMNVETNYTYSTSKTATSSPYYVLNNNDELSTGVKLIVGDGPTAIGERAFDGCTNLTRIILPNNVTAIGEIAFSDCTSLTTITIPDGVGAIGSNTFSGCDSLTSVTIPESVTTIGEYAFGYCDKLSSVTFGENSLLATIGKCAFVSCESLTSVTFGENSRLTTIGQQAFQGCTSLTGITLPDSVTTIGTYAFAGCGVTNVNIPVGVTSIDSYTFQRCTSLKSIVIPDGVTRINQYAFTGCTNLTSITFEGTVTQWKAITKVYYWNNNVPATQVVCSDGTVSLG